jgi:hypothetical protein
MESVKIKSVTIEIINEDKLSTNNVIMKSVHATVAAVEKQ